jgi:hypothetical protein
MPAPGPAPSPAARYLSSDAILAIQSLKRLTSVASALDRLLKAELQRQGHWPLAFAALQPWYRPEPARYATFVSIRWNP